jgi:hypothetical protein
METSVIEKSVGTKTFTLSLDEAEKRDDQVPLQPPRLSFVGWLLELGRRRANLDQLLLYEATAYGSVVGLGNPRDKAPPYGAAWKYVDEETWKLTVSDLTHRSMAVLVCIDDTNGIWWEIEHLAAQQISPKPCCLFIRSTRAGTPTRTF